MNIEKAINKLTEALDTLNSVIHCADYESAFQLMPDIEKDIRNAIMILQE